MEWALLVLVPVAAFLGAFYGTRRVVRMPRLRIRRRGKVEQPEPDPPFMAPVFNQALIREWMYGEDEPDEA